MVFYQDATLNSLGQRRETNHSMDREMVNRPIHKETDTIKVRLMQPTKSKLVDLIKRNGKLADNQTDNETDIPNGEDIVKLPLVQPKENTHSGHTKPNEKFTDHHMIDNETEITKEEDIVKLPLMQPKKSKHKTKHKHRSKRLTDHRMIDILCDMYRRQVTTGNMCHQLCNSKTLGNSIEQKDIGDKSGKRVFMLNCRSCLPDRRITSVVMKLFWVPSWENDTNAEIREHKTVKSCEEYLHAQLKEYATMYYYGKILKRAENILTVIWGEKIERDANENDRLAVLRSISGLRWRRVDLNDEYLALRFFQKLPFIPRLYGTCGPAYFVERAPTLVDMGYMNDKAPPSLSWIREVEISLKLLQTAKDMDNALGQGLALCDFKTKHFGLTNDDRIVITDLDYLKYSGVVRSSLPRRPSQRNFRSPRPPRQTNCTENSQCHKWACTSDCNLQTKTCEMVWTNNNLQRMCNLVFKISQSFEKIIKHSQPSTIRDRLRENLSKCTSLAFSNKTQLRIASEQVYDEFKEILTQLTPP